MQRSESEDKELQEQRLAAQTRVHGRLHANGLRHIPTEADGNCLFNAVISTMGLAVTPMELRQQCCDYIEANSRFFEDSFADGHAGLLRHVNIMRKSGTWGTAYEVTALSHLLLRPIHLITDTALDAESTTIVKPPDCIAQEAWETTLYLGHFLAWHFEGTAVIVASGASSSSSSSSSSSND